MVATRSKGKRAPELSRYDWDFDNVPDNELVACCYWEYARESSSVRDIAQIDPGWNVLYPKPFPKPWQSLAPALKRKLSMQAVLQLSVIPFRVISTRVPWSGKQARQTRMVLPGGEERIVNKDGVEVLLAEIDWGTYTDSQILESFGKWIETSRPPGVGKVDTRGMKTGKKRTRWWVMLKRLAIMRLLFHATLSEMHKKFPEAEKRYQSADWYRERKNAKIHFHELTPVPTTAEIPLSYNRAR